MQRAEGQLRRELAGETIYYSGGLISTAVHQPVFVVLLLPGHHASSVRLHYECTYICTVHPFHTTTLYACALDPSVPVAIWRP